MTEEKKAADDEKAAIKEAKKVAKDLPKNETKAEEIKMKAELS